MPYQTKQQAGFRTTLNAIRAHYPCAEGWQRLLTYLGKTKSDDEPLPMLTILDSNGVDDALWCLRSVEGADIFARHFAVDIAERLRSEMRDKNSTAALKFSRMHALGQASDYELCVVAEWARIASVIADKAWVDGLGGAASAWAATAAYWAAAADAADAACGTAWATFRYDASERDWQATHLRLALSNPAEYISLKSMVPKRQTSP